jgi:16S rRNA (adenine1518-N6/adenine1519-N6)-dimethyltransferase
MFVRPKKSLGQHFLNDKNIARKIVSSIEGQPSLIIEIGPGMGILTQFLNTNNACFKVVEIDKESVCYLIDNKIVAKENIIEADFLKIDFSTVLTNNTCIIGNFPYNISSQIFFRILENRNTISQTVCMIQKEVAERIAAPPGSKTYGILSVLLQAYFKIEYLFTVHEHVFIPPPKVKSAVIRLTRNENERLNCNEETFKRLIKMAFNQRRKTLRNSLRQAFKQEQLVDSIFDKRPEQLSVNEFVFLSQMAEK